MAQSKLLQTRKKNMNVLKRERITANMSGPILRWDSINRLYFILSSRKNAISQLYEKKQKNSCNFTIPFVHENDHQ